MQENYKNFSHLLNLSVAELKIFKKYINEYDDTFQKILIISPYNFLKNVFERAEMSSGNKINGLSKDKKEQIENYIERIIYENDSKFASYIKKLISQRTSIELSTHKFSGEIFQHCPKDKKEGYYIHSCGKNFQTFEYNLKNFKYLYEKEISLNKILNPKFDISKIENINNIILYCIECNMIYKSNLIKFRCHETDIDFYSKISISENLSKIFLPYATWEHYHCNAVINDAMKCPTCHEYLFFIQKNKKIFCKKCNYEMDPMKLQWKCVICKQFFSVNAKIFNPLEYKALKISVKDSIINKIKAKPKFGLECGCDFSNEKLKFIHKKSCLGELFLGEYNSKKVVVCSKCGSLSFYDEYIWTCPLCFKKSKENNENEFNKKRKISVNLNECISQYGSNPKRSFFGLIKNNSNNENIIKNNVYINQRYIERNKSENNVDYPKIFQKRINTEIENTNDKINKNNLLKRMYSNAKKENCSPNIIEKEVIQESYINKTNIKNINNSNFLYKLQTRNNKLSTSSSNNLIKNSIKNVISSNNMISLRNLFGNHERKNSQQIYNNTQINKYNSTKFDFKNVSINNNQNPLVTSENFLLNSTKINPLVISLDKKFISKKKSVNNINIDMSFKEKQINKRGFSNDENIDNNKQIILKKIICLKCQSNSNYNKKNFDTSKNKKETESTTFESVSNSVIYYTKYNKEDFSNRKFDINDYKIIKQIGVGSFGSIYMVEDDYHNKYALKKIIAMSLKEMEKLEREYKILINLQKRHEKSLNLVYLYNISTKKLDPTTYVMYVLMELGYSDWEKEILKRQKNNNFYSEKELMKILSSLIKTFAHLQRENISHRDIKPQNILYFKEKNIFKLADFGEAKELIKTENTNKMTLRGTELYMSPILFYALRSRKVMKYVKHNPFKSDVFSFGLCSLLAATLTFDSIYDIRELKDNLVIKSVITKYLKKYYSNKLIDIIGLMLTFNENDRKDFIGMEKEFQKIGY